MVYQSRRDQTDEVGRRSRTCRTISSKVDERKRGGGEGFRICRVVMLWFVGEKWMDDIRLGNQGFRIKRWNWDRACFIQRPGQRKEKREKSVESMAMWRYGVWRHGGMAACSYMKVCSDVYIPCREQSQKCQLVLDQSSIHMIDAIARDDKKEK